MHCLCPLKTWAVCRFGRFPIRPGAFACSTSISVGRTCFNMAWVSGGALWLAARSTGKIGNEMRAYVCWGCEIVQTCVWIIAQQLCAMQQINVALCQATANISASLVCVSLTVFFFPLLLLLLLGTFNALHTYNCSTWKCQLHIQDPLLHYCLFGCRKLVFSTFKFTEREPILGGRTVRIAGRRLTLPTARK